MNQTLDSSVGLYSDDEVVIMLARNDKTESMKWYSVYSEDYSTINENSYDVQRAKGLTNIKLAESTEYIENELRLGVEFSEMRLLNPSPHKARNGLYEIDLDHNNIYVLKLDGTSVSEALEILNANPDIEIAEPNYYYEYYEIPNDFDAGIFRTRINDPFYQHSITYNEMPVSMVWTCNMNHPHDFIICVN